MTRYSLHDGEYLAIRRGAVRRDADGFFLLCGPGAEPNERHGAVGIVNVRGSLVHHAGFADSYDAVYTRVRDAMDGKSGDEERGTLKTDDPPGAVLMRIDSPGGVVSGCFETVARLRALSRERGIPLVAYVDETAGSAAYALACACEEIAGPATCVVGSVGVISTMATVMSAEAKAGVRVVLIASGEFKADGNPHGPLTDGAVTRERERVMDLAREFFALVAKARGMSAAKVEGMKAAVALGRRARTMGLIDRVESFDATIAAIDTGRNGSL